MNLLNEKADVNAGDTAFNTCVEFSPCSTTKSITSFISFFVGNCAGFPELGNYRTCLYLSFLQDAWLVV